MSDLAIKYKEAQSWTEFRSILERWLQYSGRYGPCGCEKAAILGAIDESEDLKRTAMLKEVLSTIELLEYYWPEPKFDQVSSEAKAHTS